MGTALLTSQAYSSLVGGTIFEVAPLAHRILCLMSGCHDSVASALSSGSAEHEPRISSDGIAYYYCPRGSGVVDEFGEQSGFVEVHDSALRALNRISATCSSIAGDLFTLISTLPQSVPGGTSSIQDCALFFDGYCECEQTVQKTSKNIVPPTVHSLVQFHITPFDAA